jgi:hypothetical protein
MLGGLKLQLDPERLSEPVGVQRQPGSGVQRLMRPDRPRVHRLQSPKIWMPRPHQVRHDSYRAAQAGARPSN